MGVGVARAEITRRCCRPAPPLGVATRHTPPPHAPRLFGRGLESNTSCGQERILARRQARATTYSLACALGSYESAITYTPAK